jgi:hypothetical protein
VPGVFAESLKGQWYHELEHRRKEADILRDDWRKGEKEEL